MSGSHCSIACVALSILVACDGVTEVSRLDLAQVVERDGVPFAVESIPNEIVDRLASHRLVIVGETHLLREHRDLMSALIRRLHARGFRQMLLEWPHATDWLLRDFVNDRGGFADWEPSVVLGGRMIEAVRDFNRTLPDDEHFQVRAIDVNLSDYGGGDAFMNLLGALAGHIPPADPIELLLQSDYGSPESQREHVETAQMALRADREGLIASWGNDWYDVVTEMLDMELASIGVRGLREAHYDASVRLRENVMKRVADLRLEGYEHGTVVNIGSNHAQKAYLRGTNQEWLGDYLVHESGMAGPAFVVAVTAARIQRPSGEIEEQLGRAPENGLFRLMQTTWPDQVVYLPLDDPYFREVGVPITIEQSVYVCAPKKHYDAFILLPFAHRVPFS